MSEPVELERKFLVAQLPDLAAVHVEVIKQGYLTHASDSVEVRLRQKGAKFFITLKNGQGLERGERESEITREIFNALWPGTRGRRIEKTRWTGALPGGRVYELDIFDLALAGLKLVEVEFPTLEDATAFEPPEWFGREITNDSSYSNACLACNNAPDHPRTDDDQPTSTAGHQRSKSAKTAENEDGVH